MPRLISSRPTSTLIAVSLALGTAMAFPAGAETRIETVLGTVTNSDPIRTSYIRKTPSDERVCETQDVPIYGQASASNNNNNNSDLGAMIIGGVIGSAIGNKTSDQEGAGAAGAVVGALLGREHAKKKNQGGGGQQIVGYRQQEVCNVRTVMIEETIQEITGYRTRIEVDNRIITVETSNPLSTNERVELTRQTTYSLR
jgi:outer membrane lipoprotein SlyB